MATFANDLNPAIDSQRWRIDAHWNAIDLMALNTECKRRTGD